MRYTTRLTVLAMVAFAVLGWGCAGPPPEDTAAANVEARAIELAHETLIVDTHIDLPYRLQGNLIDITQRTEDGHMDGPRAREGGLDAAFMSIFVPARLHGRGRNARRRAPPAQIPACGITALGSCLGY